MNTTPLFSEDEIYSVSDFLKRCQQQITNHIPSCWLSGELTNLYQAKSGHSYFKIKDENALVDCVLFRLNQRHLKFKLENNLSFLIRAKASLYQDKGSFQLVVEAIEPTGIGSLQLAFEQLKRKLTLEGLFAEKHKKTLPEKPKKIAIISAATGAVIHDIYQVISKQYPYVTISLYDTLVQGEHASKQIAKAIASADKDKHDVLMVARGGGSLEDLWSFNEEVVVRAIFSCQTPIVSAVGHQTDTTLSDLVADVRAATPSIGAQIIVPDKAQLIKNNQQYHTQLKQLLGQIISHWQTQLGQKKRLLATPKNQIDYAQLKLTSQQQQLLARQQQYITAQQQTLNIKQSLLKALSPQQQSQQKQQQLDHLNNKIHQIIQSRHQQQVGKFRNQLQQLNTLSPLNTLSRGYSISFDSKAKIINNASQVNIGDTVRTHFKRGTIDATVTDIQAKND